MKNMAPAALLAAMYLMSATSGFGWEHSARTSPIDDTTIYQISTRAAEATTDRFGQKGSVDLIIQCESNTTLLAFVFSAMYMSDHGAWGDVTFRVDSDQAFSRNMLGSNDNSALALRGGDAIQVIKEFMDGEKLFVRALPVNERSQDLTFRVKGASVALKSIREKCGW